MQFQHEGCYEAGFPFCSASKCRCFHDWRKSLSQSTHQEHFPSWFAHGDPSLKSLVAGAAFDFAVILPETNRDAPLDSVVRRNRTELFKR